MSRTTSELTRTAILLGLGASLALSTTARAQTGDAPAEGDADEAAALPSPGDVPEEGSPHEGAAPAEPVGEAEPVAPPAAEPAPPEEAAAEPGPEPEPEPENALQPPGEEEGAGSHPVDPAIAFRPGKGLQIESEDGDFSLTARFRTQILYTLEDPDGGDLEQSLTLRRARLQLGGHFFGEHNSYKLQLAFAPRDMGVRDNLSQTPAHTPLLDFYFDFTHLRDLSLRIGQYKVAFNRQRLVSSGNLAMVDRSIVNSEFNLDRDVGFDLHSKDLFGLDMLRYNLGVYIARGRDAVGADDFGLMYVGRLELLPFGTFDDLSEADFDRSSDPRLGIGAALGFVDRGHGNRGNRGSAPLDGGTTDMMVFGADAIFKIAGFSAQTEFILRSVSRESEGLVDPMTMLPYEVERREGFGWMLQAGYLIPRLPLEATARYGMIRGSGDETTLGDSNEAGLALSWYVARHPFKVQADFFRLWGDDFEAGDNRLRVQLQGSL